MASCPPALLHELRGLLARVRTWPGVVEKTPGVFYLRRQPFLHFHLLGDGRRRADVRGATAWVQLDLPRPITATVRRALAQELRLRYSERTAPAIGRARSDRR